MKINLPARVLLAAALLGLLILQSPVNRTAFSDPVPEDPAHLWRGNGDATDATNTAHGTWVGLPAYEPGKSNGLAFYFQPGHYVSTGATLDPTNNFTLATWVSFSDTGGARALFAKDEGPGDFNKWILFYNNFKLRFLVQAAGGAAQWLEAEFHPVPGPWYHVALVRTGAVWNFYGNGELKGSVTNDLALPEIAAPLTLGHAEEGIELDGLMDDAAIYSRALAGGEVLALYAAGFPAPPATGSTPQPLAAWQFQNSATNDAGDAAVDATGVQWVSSVAGTGARLTSDTNAPAGLTFMETATNGQRNFRRDHGTVRFWFRPDWSSVSANGDGPGHSVRLVAAGGSGNAPHDAWTIWIDPSGDYLSFSSRWGVSVTNHCWADIQWNAGEWHHVTFTYSTNGTALYLDGTNAATGPGLKIDWGPASPNFYLGGNGTPGNGQYVEELNHIYYWQESYNVEAHWENDYYVDGYWEGVWVDDEWVEGHYETVTVPWSRTDRTVRSYGDIGELLTEETFENVGLPEGCSYDTEYMTYDENDVLREITVYSLVTGETIEEQWVDDYWIRHWEQTVYYDGYWETRFVDEYFVNGYQVDYWESGWLLGYVDGQNESAHGTFDVLETFDGPLAPADVYLEYLDRLRNERPAFDQPPDVTVVNDNVTAYYVVVANILSGPAHERWQTLSVSAAVVSNPTNLMPTPGVGYTNPQPTARVTFQPVANMAGVATITVTASDNGGTANGGVNHRSRAFVVTVLTNAPPLVNAGTNQNLFLPNNSVFLNGSASDDGLPVGSSLTVLGWTVAGNSSGGTVEFFPTNAANTFATFTTNGTYTLRLTATDGTLTNYDEVDIHVYPPNQPPVVNAWVTNSVVMVSNTVNVFATAPDDGLPLGSTVTSLWSVADGPGEVTFSNATALNTTATFTNAGTYALRFTAGDGEFTVSRSVLVSKRTPSTNGPLLVITNLVSGEVTPRPVIQIKGYSTNDLVSLYIERLDAGGNLLREDGFLIDRDYLESVVITNSYMTNGVVTNMITTNLVGRYTTNWFQYFDMELNSGTNLLILHAFNADGFETVTNYTVVFSTVGDTNAPVVTMHWPQNNMALVGTNFTARGVVDDPTAKVTAVITSGTNSASLEAMVERDGKFWLEKLPLFDGTNILAITASDAAGLTSFTNLTLTKSAVVLTVNPVNPLSYTERWLALSGTVAAGYGVEVNGMSAVVTNGEWIVIAPVEEGYTATVDIQTTDGGGDGPGLNLSLDRGDADNDGAELVLIERQAIRARSDWALEGDPEPGYEGPLSTWGEMNQRARWINGVLVSWERASSSREVFETLPDNWEEDVESLATGVKRDQWELYGYAYDDSWTYPNWPQGALDIMVEASTNSLGLVNSHLRRTYGGSQGNTSAWTTEHRETEYVQYTGGKGTGKNVFRFDANMWDLDADDAVQPENIEVLGQTLDSAGVMYAALPDRARVIVTPKPQNVPNWSAGVGSQKYRLTYECVATYPTNRTRRFIGVGEKVRLFTSPPFAGVTWEVDKGGLSGDFLSDVIFTAPSNAAAATVTASFSSKAKLELTFAVRAPQSETAEKNGADLTFPSDDFGAGMNLIITVHPTSVSFARVKMSEVAGPATDGWGFLYNQNLSNYYHWPNHLMPGVERSWQQLNVSNKWTDQVIFSGNFIPKSSMAPGGYKLNIPVVWRVGDDDDEHAFSERTSVKKVIDSNGSASVNKLGKEAVVTRP